MNNSPPVSVKNSRNTSRVVYYCECLCAHVQVEPTQNLTRVAVCEQGADGQQHLGDGEGWTPVILQDVQTDYSLAVDIAVIDPCTECYLT